LRVCVARGAVVAAALVRPPPKLSFVTLQIQMREEQRVIRDLPERIFDSVLDQRSGGQRSMVSRSIVSAAWYWLFSTDRRVASALDMMLNLDRRRRVCHHRMLSLLGTEHPAGLLVVTAHRHAPFERVGSMAVRRDQGVEPLGRHSFQHPARN